MKNTLSVLSMTIVLAIVVIALAGMYKFNYLSSQDGYDADGNKIEDVLPQTNDENITVFLEENLLEPITSNGKVFCAYETLAVEENDVYLHTLCEEYYVQDKELVCPTEEARQACFAAKDPVACEKQCSKNDLAPYLATGSGTSAPVKLTKENGAFVIWTPRDGSYYAKDLEEMFIPAAHKKLNDIDTGHLQAAVIDQAETYFGIEAAFEVSGVLGGSCQSYTDCGPLPFEYAAISRCPHQVACTENQCVAGCYDFFDHATFPRLGASEPSVIEQPQSSLPAVPAPVIDEITNFSECEAAGYDIMESYPRQCRDPQTGKTFTEKVVLEPEEPSVPIQNIFPEKIVYGDNMGVLDEQELRVHCTLEGGRFSTCGSVCPKTAEMCTDQCAYTCELDPSATTF